MPDTLTLTPVTVDKRIKGLYPSTTLFPSTTVFPSAESGPRLTEVALDTLTITAAP